ncbi:MAG: protease inhibitor I42 family protein [Hyphomonadaceae bacterium]|nr:protease inhibitor I42 family protein [Hyphomonadaceae bacterium]
MRLFGLVAMAALVACAAPARSEATPAQSEATKATGAIAAPVQEDVVNRIGADMAGQTIAVAVGERFAVQLVGVPTAGYLWAPTTTPDFLEASGQGGGPTTAAQRRPGFTGGNHWEVFYFTAKEAGSGELRLEQRRPWETGGPPANSFAVTIIAE